MSKKDPARFSPLFRIRKILLFLRWFSGFPLKSKNKEFNQFEFFPCLEYTRHSLYIACFILPLSYNTYSFTKFDNLNDPIEVITKFWRYIGYSLLDICVIYTIPYINMISSTFYLRSFKKMALKFNEICLNLTNLNKELNQSLDLMSIGNKKRSKTRISLKLFRFGIFIAAMILILNGISMYILIYGNLHDFTTSPITYVQKHIFFLNNNVSSFCWVYPYITISADLIICEILEHTKEMYIHWNKILKEYKVRFQLSSDQKLLTDMSKVKSDER